MAGHLAEISIVIPVQDAREAESLVKELDGTDAEIIISCEGTRARSLNMGAAKSSRKFLWFLHADTRLPDNTFEKLEEALRNDEKALHYFSLKFMNDGPPLMKLNAWGANMRARIFGAPFGDQGFCLRKDLFFKTGGYSEEPSYGEDHLLVWQTRRHGMKLHLIHGTIETSARAYRHNWLGLTLKRQFLWIRQALPEFLLLLRGK